MRKKYPEIFIFLIALFLTSCSVMQEYRGVEIINNSPEIVTEVYIRLSDVPEWGTNLLGLETIQAGGGSRDFTFVVGIVDIMVVGSAGGLWEFPDFEIPYDGPPITLPVS